MQDGVIEPADKAEVQRLLTFEEVPERHELRQRAYALARIALNAGYEYAMIDGAPFFMSTLENALKRTGVQPLYSFTKQGTANAVHTGFYEA